MTEREQQVIGVLKYEPEAVDREMLRSVDFSSADALALYDAIIALSGDGVPVDDQSLATRSKVSLDVVVSIPWRPAANLGYHVAQMREETRLKRLHRIGITLSDAEKGRRESEVLIELVEKGLSDMVSVSERQVGPIKGMMDDYLNYVQPQWKDGVFRGIPSGLGALDGLIGGFQPGEVTIIGARPSVGKTALALSMIAEIAKSKKVGLFSLEMGKYQIIGRLVAILSRTDLTVALGRRMVHEGSGIYRQALEGMRRTWGLDLLLDSTPTITLPSLLSSARAMRRHGVEIIFVDYLTLVRYGASKEGRHMSRPERVGEISKAIKGLSRELDIPFIVLSQINREGENSKPSLAQLRQSGDVEEDADIVVLIHRPRLEEQGELLVVKNRNGPIGDIPVRFDRSRAHYMGVES